MPLIAVSTMTLPHGRSDGETVLEHAQVGDLPGGDGQHHRERGLDELPGCLHPRCQLAEDHRLAVAAEDILHLEAKPLGTSGTSYKSNDLQSRHSAF